MTTSAQRFYDRVRVLEVRVSLLPDFFIYHLTVEMGLHAATVSAVSACYVACDLRSPSWLRSHLSKGHKQGIFIRTDSGYRLDARHRETIAKMLDATPAAPAQASKSLASLEATVPAGAKRDFLSETITCFEAGANRAAVVMCWNLALHHLQDHVLSDPVRTAAFNGTLALNTDTRVKLKVVAKQDDFTEMSERKFLLFCREAKLISGLMFNKLGARLDERNAAAHPSGVKVGPSVAQAYIEDLVDNVVLKYPA